MAGYTATRQILRLAGGAQFPLRCPSCGPNPCTARTATSAFPTERSCISASCGFLVAGKGLRGQLGLGWDQRTSAELQQVAVTSEASPDMPGKQGGSPAAHLEQAFSVILDDKGTVHIAGDGMDCVFGVGGSMGVVGSYHGGAQPVAKAQFQPLQALQHKVLVGVATTKRSVAAVSASGHVFTWGSGYQGELGQGHATVSTSPTLLPLSPDAGEDAASMMMPPQLQHRITAAHAGDGFLALASAGGQVYVTGSLGPKYAGGVQSTVQVSEKVIKTAPPPKHLMAAAQTVAGKEQTTGGGAQASSSGFRHSKPQRNRPTLLVEGAPKLAAGKHHLVLAFPDYVLVAGDNSASQGTGGALPSAAGTGAFPLWHAIGRQKLPADAEVVAAYAFGDCSVVEVHLSTGATPAVRALLAWGAVPTGMAKSAKPMPCIDADASAWNSFFCLGDQGVAQEDGADGELPEVSMDTTLHAQPVLLDLGHVPSTAAVLGWWKGELLFG